MASDPTFKTHIDKQTCQRGLYPLDCGDCYHRIYGDMDSSYYDHFDGEIVERFSPNPFKRSGMCELWGMRYPTVYIEETCRLYCSAYAPTNIDETLECFADAWWSIHKEKNNADT